MRRSSTGKPRSRFPYLIRPSDCQERSTKGLRERTFLLAERGGGPPGAPRGLPGKWLGFRSIPATALLADTAVRVREAAALAAGMRELGALSVLLADDPAPGVRRACAHTLGAMSDQRVADVLASGLEDPDPLVRAAVLRAGGAAVDARGGGEAVMR